MIKHHAHNLVIAGAVFGIGMASLAALAQEPVPASPSTTEAGEEAFAPPPAPPAPGGGDRKRREEERAAQTPRAPGNPQSETAPPAETETPSQAEMAGAPEDTTGEEQGFVTLDGDLPSSSSATRPGRDVTVRTGGPELISITLDDVEMVDVVRMFTRISGANIIATPSNLQGRVTVNLTDVEWKPALESILDMHNLALREKLPGSRVYSIVTRPSGAPEPLQVRTFFLSYARVTDAEPVIRAMLPANATLSTYPSKNAVVARSTAANLGEIEQVIKEIDILRDQVFIEAKFMELDDEAIKDLGINWQSLQNYTLSAGNIARSFSDDRTWTDARNDQAFDWDKERQVESAAFSPSLPLEGQLDPARPGESVNEGQGSQASVDRGQEFVLDTTAGFARTITESRTAVLGAADFQLVLSALKQMNGVTVVSNPKIIVANEEPASIYIGQTEKPFVATVTPATDSSQAFTTYNPGEPVEFGVKLTVTPTVNTESNITVKIVPELSRFVRYDVAPDGATKYPVIAKKTIETVFTIANGKTVAIGGLTESTERDESTKIPLLGDIPLLGKYLFSHSSTRKAQSETIIFVTVGLAVPGDILRETGLPEDTHLARRHMIRESAKKQERAEDLEQVSDAVERNMAERRHAARDRLLQRRD